MHQSDGESMLVEVHSIHEIKMETTLGIHFTPIKTVVFTQILVFV